MWLMAVGIAVLMGEMLCAMEEKMVEESQLAWVEGIELNERGDIFRQGDDVCFTGESCVAVMAEIECGRVRIAEGAEVTLIPYAGDLVLEELRLEGTLIFTAPWIGYHWTIIAEEKGLIVLDFGTFDLDLEPSLPGPYDGALELRSGRVHYRGNRATGASNFSQLRVTEEGQFYLRAGSEYEGDVYAMGSGWIREQEEGGKGALRFEGTGADAAVMRGKLTLEGDLSVQVYGEGEEGRVESELDAAGHALEKWGEGTLRVMGGKWRGLRELVAREGLLVLEGDADAGATYQESGELIVSGGGMLELRGKVRGLSLLQMAEAAQLHVQSGEIQADELCGFGKLTAEDGQVSFDQLRDFNGEINAQLMKFRRAVQGEGYTATVHGQVVTDSFAKGGEGTLRLDSLRVNGELCMRYSGTLELGELVLEDGTLLHYGEGDFFVRVRDELLSREQLATHEVRLVVDSREFDEWQLQRGVRLGVGADLAENFVVSGSGNYRLEDQDGELWLYAEPPARTADWDPNWGERTLLRQPGTHLPEILLAEGEELAMLETTLPCRSEDGSSSCARFRGIAGDEGAAVYGGCVTEGELASGESHDSWIDATQGYFTHLVGGNACGEGYNGQTHLLLRDGEVQRMVGGNDSVRGDAQFEGECFLSVYDATWVGEVLCSGSACSGGNSSFTGQTHCFVYTLLGEETIVSGANFYEQSGGGSFEGKSSVMLEFTGKSGEFAATVTGGDYSFATSAEAKLSGETQIIVRAADNTVRFNGMLIGGSCSAREQEIKASGRTMVQIDGGMFKNKVVGGSATLGEAAISGSADAILLLHGGIYQDFVIGGCYAEGQEWAEVQLGNVLVEVEEGVVLQNLVGGSMVQGGGEVQQGSITLRLRGGEIEGDVYASGSGNASFSTQDVMVSVGNNVRFGKEGAILSGSVRRGKVKATDDKTLTESYGERCLVFTESGEYENMRGVVVEDFDVLELAPGARVDLGGLVTDSVLLRGGGELELHVGKGSVHADELVVGKGTRLNIDAAAEHGERLDARVRVGEGGMLRVDLVHGEETRNAQLDTEGITLQRGGTLELELYFTRSMMRGGEAEEGRGVLGDGQLIVEEGGVLSLHPAGVGDELPLTGGHAVEFVLAEHAQGVPELDAFTQGWLAEYFGNTARIEVVEGRLLLTGESVSEQTAHFYRDASCTPNGHAGAELLDSLMSVVDPQNTAPGSDRAKLLQTQEQLISSGKMSEADDLFAAAAGASLSALQPAFTTELRQALQSVADTALRDERSEGCNGAMIWTVQGRGSTQRLTESDNNSGYSMTSWGGTLTMQRDFSDSGQLGVQLSAIGGKWHALAADTARADCEVYSLIAYYRIRRGRLIHAFVGQGAMTRARVDRNLFFAGDAHETTGRTTGGGFSALYALAYEANRPEASVQIRPLMQVSWTRGFLEGYQERGSDIALTVEDQHQEILSIGVGVALSGASSQILSRSCEWETQFLLAAEGGELAGEVHTSMQYGGHYRTTLRSRRPGCIVAELAASFAVPLSRCTAVIAQAVAELRERSNGVAASLGYRLRF